MQERLTEIEIKLAHLERTVNDLSDVLVKQHDLIDGLRDRYDRLSARVAGLADGLTGEQQPGEKPPHY